MIITVTLNPAFDKTVLVQGFKQGKLNRADNVTVSPGGKGLNVSMMLKRLGADSTAIGIFGKNNGAEIVNALSKHGIQVEAVYTDGDTRTNTKIISGGELTELNEPGPRVGDRCKKELIEAVRKYADKGNIFVFAGSVPQSMETGIYFELINEVKNAGALAILDCDGEAFREGIKAAPYAVKPNLAELFSFIDRDFGGTIPDDYMSYTVSYSEEIIGMGVKQVVVSLGAEGAYFSDGINNEFKSSEISSDEVKTSVGAGDSMVAAMAYALEKGLDFEAMTELSMKAAADACRNGILPSEQD